jgi:hypothetical protein
MNSNERTHPIEIALFLALVTVEAVVVLASALVALVLALVATSQKPSASRTKPSALPATPMVHPLCNLAADLQALTCKELAQLVGTRKRLNKSQLVGMVVAVGV